MTAGALPSCSKGQDIPTWFGVLVVVAFWLMARPYTGVRHDGILYMGQALLHLNPVVMSRDLFFAYGSQDQFSLASNVLAALYGLLGMARAQVAVLVAGQALLLTAAVMLLKSLSSSRQRWLGVCTLAVCSHIFGGRGIFAFAETFVTARTLAEPLALLAVALALRGRAGAALALLLAAAALHPLVTIPVALVVWLLLWQADPRWRRAGWLVTVPLALAAFGIAPFSALFSRYDAAWWESLSAATPQVLLLMWESADWQLAVFDVGVLLVAALTLPLPLARLARATLVCTAALLLVSFIGADLLHNVLITQLQVWRVLWLTHLLALISLPAVIGRLWTSESGGRLAALALVAALVATNSRWQTGWAFVGWAALTVLWWHRSFSPSLAVARLAAAVTALAVVGLSIAIGRSTLEALASHHDLDRGAWLIATFGSPALALPMALVLLASWRRSRSAAVVAIGLTTTTLAIGAADWDRRTPWTRFIEASAATAGSTAFDIGLPPTAQVYWHGEVPAVWAALKRPSYYSGAQGGGLLFQRQTAAEFSGRTKALAPLMMQINICSMLAGLEELPRSGESCFPTLEVVAHVCRAPSPPDYLVFESLLPKGLKSTWKFESPDGRSRTFFLYDCAQLR